MPNITIHHFFVLCLYDCPEWIKFWAVFALLSPPCQGGNGCGARIVQLEKCLPSITRDDEDGDKNHFDDIDDDGVNDDEGDGDVMWIWGLHSTGWVVVPLIKHSNLRLQALGGTAAAETARSGKTSSRALPTSVTPSAQTEAPLTPYSKYHLPLHCPRCPLE